MSVWTYLLTVFLDNPSSLAIWLIDTPCLYRSLISDHSDSVLMPSPRLIGGLMGLVNIRPPEVISFQPPLTKIQKQLRVKEEELPSEL